MTSNEDTLRNADLAHSRLLMDAHVTHALSGTTYEALREVAKRHRTLEVPQIAKALKQLREEER